LCLRLGNLAASRAVFRAITGLRIKARRAH
jgi:hypothetical protein